MVPIKRSQIAFALGLRGGDLRIVSPSRFMDSSRPAAKNAITIVEEVSIVVCQVRLLHAVAATSRLHWDGPDVEMQQPARAMVDDDKDIEQPKVCSHRDKEVASDNRLCVVPEKGRAALISAWATRRLLGHVFPDGSWREPDTELDEQLVGDPFFTPHRVLVGHAPYQMAQLVRNWRPTRS